MAEASDSESEDDVPPPLPPPRTESLKKEVVVVGDGVSVVLADAEPFQPANPHNHLPVKLVALTNGHNESEEAGSGGSVPGSGESGGSSVSTAFSSSADQSPAKIILTEQKLEERKREMELKRRKKKEETTSTENKIAQMKKEIHQAEEWSRRKEYLRQTVMPFCVGLLVCAAGYYNLRSS